MLKEGLQYPKTHNYRHSHDHHFTLSSYKFYVLDGNGNMQMAICGGLNLRGIVPVIIKKGKRLP